LPGLNWSDQSPTPTFLKEIENKRVKSGGARVGNAGVRGKRQTLSLQPFPALERRVGRAENDLVEHGVPEDHIDTKSFGEEQQITPDQIKQQMADNPDLTPEERQQLEKNFSVLVLANNLRVDITLSTTGQQSVIRSMPRISPPSSAPRAAKPNNQASNHPRSASPKRSPALWSKTDKARAVVTRLGPSVFSLQTVRK
jgi:hypothetical protein